MPKAKDIFNYAQKHFDYTQKGKISIEFIAGFIFLSKWIYERQNDDGSMPVRRHEKLWQSLYRDGFLPCSFDSSKFKAVRDVCESLGLIEYQDNTHQPGQACKWSLTDKFYNWYSNKDVCIASFVRTPIFDDWGLFIVEPIRPVREVRYTPFFELQQQIEEKVDKIIFCNYAA